MSKDNKDFLLAGALVIGAVMYSRRAPAYPVATRPSTGVPNQIPANIGNGVGQAIGGALGHWLGGVLTGSSSSSTNTGTGPSYYEVSDNRSGSGSDWTLPLDGGDTGNPFDYYA